MRTFTVPTKPYGFRLYSRKEVTLFTGLTVLIGCNGSGKSTLMMLLKDQLKHDENALVLEYDDRQNGGHNLMEKFGFTGNMEGLATMFSSSEGEKIMIGIGDFVRKMRCEIQSNNPKEIWIFFDAIGSGLSIDGIREIKEFADIVVEDNQGTDVYFVVSTNEYEFTIGADCIDVMTFGHVVFTQYDTYRDFILRTRKKKDRRFASKT